MSPEDVKAMTPEGVEAERKHLEGLLKDRINYYMVFASVFIVGVTSIPNEAVRAVALLTWTITSFLMSFAILRTHELVMEALQEIEKTCPDHPYIRWKKRVSVSVNANTLLVPVPFILSIAFAAITIFNLCLLVWHFR